MTIRDEITRVLREVDRKMTAKEISNALPKVKAGTIGGTLSEYSGREFLFDRTGKKYLYWLNPEPENQPKPAQRLKPEPSIQLLSPVVSPSSTKRREQDLERALRNILDGYYRVTSTLPKNSLAYGFIEGAMGQSVAVAGKVIAE